MNGNETEAISLERRLRAIKMQDEQCIADAGMLGDMINEWLVENHRDAQYLAHRAGLSVRTVHRIIGAETVRVRKVTAARLLVAIGEKKLNPDVAKAYRVWAKAQNKRVRGFVVER